MLDINLIQSEISKVCPIFGVSSDGRIDFAPEATDQQKVDATALLKPTQVQLDAYKIKYQRDSAKQYLLATGNTLLRAMCLELLETSRNQAIAYNNLRLAIVNAATLAALKTAVTALPNITPIGKLAYATAVRARIDAGDGD